MRPSRSSTRPGALLLLILLSSLSVAQQAQEPEPSPFDRLPFAQWVKEGPQVQVPWQTRATYLGLSGHQRLIADIEVEVGIPGLLKRPRQGQMTLLVQVTDSSGHDFRNFENLPLEEIKNGEREGKGEYVHFSWKAFFLPGEYRVITALHHSATGEHNVSERRLKIPAINRDPLPDAWRNLPTVEFWTPLKKGDDLDYIFRPDIEGRLYLPLVTHRPVRVEVLADFAVSDIFHGSQIAYSRYLGAALPTLRILSQIDVRNGTLDITVLDLARQRVAFRQQGLDGLQWANMKKALAENDASVISVSALKIKHPGPVLFRDELMHRIDTPDHDNEAGSSPLRVFILISSPLGLYSFASLKSALLPENCSCLIYYLEYDSSRRPGFFSAIGHVKRMLRPQPVHAFPVHSSQGVRHALATILREVSQAAE